MALALAGPASAQVFWSGSVYHVGACPGPAAPGTARCHAHVITDSRGAFLTNRFGRNARGAVTPAGYGPSALASAYGVPPNAGSPATTVAIVDAYGYTNAAADLATYRSAFGLPACTVANGCLRIVNEAGGTSLPRQNTGWAQEQALDLDMVSALCPYCRILLVQANSSSYADLAAAVNEAAALGAHSIGNSYGGGESGSQSYEPSYNHPGVAITASTGDSSYSAGPSFPATSPHVTAVGGTTLSQANTTRGWTETAWADGGSGCSKVYGKPTWQKDPLCTMRMEADVSAVGDPNTGVAVYGPASSRSSAWLVFGGTSVSAQVISAIYGVNAQAVNYGSNPYPPGALTNLNDVTSGTNGSCGGTYFCTAGTGYDGPTGLGTPSGVAGF